jgi:hypothetical protein
MGRRMMKSLCAVAVGATAVFGVGAGAAFAGEVTGPSGSGKPTGAPFHANSICVFSGLNDDPDAPKPRLGGRTQRPRRGVAVLRAGRQAGSPSPSVQPSQSRRVQPDQARNFARHLDRWREQPERLQ